MLEENCKPQRESALRQSLNKLSKEVTILLEVKPALFNKLESILSPLSTSNSVNNLNQLSTQKEIPEPPAVVEINSAVKRLQELRRELESLCERIEA